jgi:hypothetical protein
VYQSGVLYNRFDDGTTVSAGQLFIDNTELSFVFLQGEYQESGSGGVSVEPRAVSERSNAVAVRGAGGDPINITVPMNLPNGTVGESGTVGELLEGEMATNGGRVINYECSGTDPCGELRVDLEGGQVYRLKMANVSVGTNVSEPTPEYVTDIEGDESAVPEGGQQPIVVEVRDAFNNPYSDTEVSAVIPDLTNNRPKGQFASTATDSVTTASGEDGRARFRYVPPEDIDQAAQDDGNTRTVTIHIALGASAPTGTNQCSDNPECAIFTVYVLNTDGS